MTATLTGLRQALAANLARLGDDIQVSAYMLASPTPPTIHLYPSEVTYDLAARRGLDMWFFTVQAFVGATSDIGAQKRLDGYIDPKGSQSVKQAIESDSYLAGQAGDVTALSCSGYRIYTREGGPPVLGAEWRIQVLAAGN
jgi:hypothetical protein